MKWVAGVALAVQLLATIGGAVQAQEASPVFSSDRFPTFSFPELLTLSKEEPLPASLDFKLDTVLHSAVLENPFPGATPTRVARQGGGTGMRVAEWNIERGERYDWAISALRGGDALRSRLLKDNPEIAKATLEKALAEAKILRSADVLILNEVDWGMGRSGYRNVARDMARALKMNFVWAAEFAEVDPLKLGTEELKDEDVANDQSLKNRLEEELKSDPARYKGLHGSAILSRYPISHVSVQRLPVCHDWFEDERKEVSKIEQGKRLGSDKIFMEKIEREIRRGGRIAIYADLAVKDVPGGTVTVVNAHLENKCPPACRRDQTKALLEKMQTIRNPVILSGDLNTTGSDAANLSLTYIVKSKVKDYRFWAQQAVMWGTGIPTTAPLNYFKNYSDPTALDIPIFGNNKEAALFNDLEKFRFDDGGRFDFGGTAATTANGKGGRLASSNQRALKGFAYTFSLPRDFKGAVGRFKLDWFFVKPAYNDNQPTGIMSPYNPHTLMGLNTSPLDRISDHAPITVDLVTAKATGK